MGRGLMPVEFDDGLIGAKAGDEAHIEFSIPETSSNPEFVGKTATFDIDGPRDQGEDAARASTTSSPATSAASTRIDELRDDIRANASTRRR